MNDAAQTVILVAVLGFGSLLALRLLVAIPGWLRGVRRPEARAVRVIGVGGGGSNAVDRMVAARIPGVSFVACNTDAQALRGSTAASKLRIGESITRGLGAGGDPEVGRAAAEEDEARIVRAVGGADLVFVTAGLGGGTGSGAAPIVGAAARESGALTIAVVTRPFAFEGAQRQRVADGALAALAERVDAIITIPNDRVADVVADDAPMVDAFRVVDDVLLQVVRGIIDLLDGRGLINLDFADVRAVLQDAGPAVIGLGQGRGEDRAIEAARQAIASPLLEARIQGARGVLLHVAGPPDLQLREVRLAADEIRAVADPEANVIFGASLDRPSGDAVLVTLIATGSAPSTSEVGRSLEARPAVGHRAPPSDRRDPVPAPSERRPRRRKVAATTTLRALPEAASVGDRASPLVGVGIGAAAAGAEDVDLEVPSFLRRRPG